MSGSILAARCRRILRWMDMPQTGDQNAVPKTDAAPLRAGVRPAAVSEHAPDAQARTNLEKVHVVRARQPSSPSQSERQAARIQRLMMAGVLALLYMSSLGFFYLQGLIALRTLQIAAVLIGATFLLFRLIFALKLNLKAKERSLRLPIALAAIASTLFVVYLAPVTQIIFTPFLFVIIAFLLHRLPPRTVLLLAVLTLAAYASVVALHYAQQGSSAMLMLEGAQLFVLALTLPGLALVANRVQRLNNALFRASRKIKDIEEDAQRDVMLGCFNRRYIVAALEQQKRLADDTGSTLCLAVIDLDHFKRINDEAGHLSGDEVLRTFARIAQQNVREGDVFGRYGGEEFLLVLPETSLLAALNVAERIREQVEHYAWEDKLRNRVTVSIGLTQHIPGESVLDLFSRTDTAMYMAKQGGRNQVVVEEPAADNGAS